MSPTTDPSSREDYLEHPKEAFEYYRKQGVTTMVVEKKHMGSRAILLLFKDAEAAVDYVGSAKGRLIQPAIKVRGKNISILFMESTTCSLRI